LRVLEKETEYGVDAVDFCETAVHIMDGSGSIAFSCPEILLGSYDPGACTISQWVDHCVTNKSNDMSLNDGGAQCVGVGMWSDVVP